MNYKASVIYTAGSGVHKCVVLYLLAFGQEPPSAARPWCRARVMTGEDAGGPGTLGGLGTPYGGLNQIYTADGPNDNEPSFVS